MGCNILLIFQEKKKKKIRVNSFMKASEETLVAWSFSCQHQSVLFCWHWQRNAVFAYASLFINIVCHMCTVSLALY